MNGIGREFWARVLIISIKKSREPEKPIASIRGGRDVTDRPQYEVIVVEYYCFFMIIIVAPPRSQTLFGH